MLRTRPATLLSELSPGNSTLARLDVSHTTSSDEDTDTDTDTDVDVDTDAGGTDDSDASRNELELELAGAAASRVPAAGAAEVDELGINSGDSIGDSAQGLLAAATAGFVCGGGASSPRDRSLQPSSLPAPRREDDDEVTAPGADVGAEGMGGGGGGGGGG